MNLLINVLVICIGSLAGAYVALVILYRDFNIKRGVGSWVDKIVREAFKKI